MAFQQPPAGGPKTYNGDFVFDGLFEYWHQLFEVTTGFLPTKNILHQVVRVTQAIEYYAYPLCVLLSITATTNIANHTPKVCPHCANLLILSRMETGGNRVECRTCPFERAIEKPFYSRKSYPRKEKEDVFGGPGAWDNAQKAAVQCPVSNCDGSEAAFFQVQIRSADEPMTMFYKVGPLCAIGKAED